MKKVLLKIDGMTCSACSSGLEKYLNKQDGIKTAVVNLVMNNANIEYDEKKLTLEQVEKFVEKAGFTSLGIDNFEKEEKKKSNEKYKLMGISVISILILYISMAHMVKLPVIPYLDMMHNPVNYAIALLILTTIVILFGKDIIKNGYKNLIHKTPNMDTLVMIGVLASYVYSIYGTIRILQGHTMYVEKLYYESAAIVIFFIKIGKFVENKNKDKTKEALQELMTITPNNATIIREEKEVDVTLDEIQKGDIVICKPGEKIAVDGEIIDGVTHINEAFITGESKPAKKEIGSKVIAGSINYEGTIKYKAEKIGKESTVSEIVRLVANATATKAPIAKIADKISGYFVPVVLVISIISFVLWLIISKDIAIAINIFVSILVVACPCSLGLATPLAIVIASGNASRKGILVKTSEALENFHKAKTICFDKTGTLTKGTLSISKIYNYSNLEEKELLRNIASIEKKSEHPIARAIVNKAIEEKIEFEDLKEFKAIAGFGVEAIMQNNDKYLIGNRKLMTENGVIIPNEQDEQQLVNDGNSILFVSLNNKLVALIGVKDILKDNIENVIKELKDKNINLMFYEDLRKLKDKSYNLIKSELFDFKNNGDSYNEELSNKYGTSVYDMRNKDFFMLVRAENGHRDKDRWRRNCYSIISDDNTDVFGHGSVNIYGYNSFENDRVLHMFEGDAFSGDENKNFGSRERVNRIMTPEELANSSSWYSEIQLVNIKDSNSKNTYFAKKPDFIVVYNKPSEGNIRESKERGIPIVIINEQRLKDDKKIEIDKNMGMYDDIYINNSYDEENSDRKAR